MTVNQTGYPAHRAGYPRLVAAIVAAASMVVGLAGCGSADHPVPDPPADPTVLVLRVEEVAGFGGPGDAGRLPEFSLYGGGRVIIPGAQDGALRTAKQYQLSGPAYQRLYRRAFATGLDQARHIEQTGVPDAGSLTISVRVGDHLQTTVVSPPNGDDPTRAAIATFRRAVQPSAWASGGGVSGPVDYQPARMAVIATWSTSAAQAGQNPTWPLGPLITGTHVGGGDCSLYGADRLTQIRSVTTSAAPGTRWIQGDGAYYVAVRPLLPDESDCGQLTH